MCQEEVINWYTLRSTQFKNNWNVEDVLWIYKNYIKSSKNELIAKFGSESRYKSAVNIANKLNIRKNKERDIVKIWTEEEQCILQENYKDKHINELLKLFPDRSINSIRRKAVLMNISQDISLLYIHHPKIYKNIDGIIYKRCKECGDFIEMNDNNFWKDNTPSGFKNTCKKCLIIDIKDYPFSNIEYTQYASGIYKITNIINGKIYIGSAVDLINRKKIHISKLNKGLHENEYLQRSWKKYGQENFIFKIIELVEDKNLLLQREQFWINNTNCCNRNIGYNICSIAGNTFGLEISNETREKLKNNIPRKEVVQCDLNGNYIAEWRSLREIQRQLGYSATGISLCCKHEYTHSHGYLWFFKEEYKDLKNTT